MKVIAMVEEYHITDQDRVRFWSKVDRSGECWVWTARTRTSGTHQYGQIGLGPAHLRMQLVAHRFSYLTEVGPIPFGILVLHHCDNPLCVRPTHLFLGTHLDNHRDKAAKHRCRNQWSPGAHGAPCARGKNTTAAVQKQIVADYITGEFSQKELGRKYRVSQTTVSTIVRRALGRLPAFLRNTTAEQRRVALALAVRT